MQPMSSHVLTHSLDLLADTYNYNHWIYSLLRPFLGPCICEIGAGIGNLSRFFLSATQLTCIEPEAEYWTVMDESSSAPLRMHAFKGPLERYAPQPSAANPTDTVVCCQLHVSHCRHINFIGAFGWWWVSRIRAQTRIDPEKARLVDRFVPFISAAERLLPPFIGQSLFAVSRKQPV